MMSLFGWGSCLDGQLGLGGIEEEKVLVARKIKIEGRVQWACCGLGHSLLLMEDGRVLSCGSNEYQQLGRDGPTKRFRPVDHLGCATQITCGSNFCLALTPSGQVFSWGCNAKGQLGRSNLEDNSVQLVTALVAHRVVQVVSGSEHALSLTDRSEVYAWGCNDEGQLGLGLKAPHQPVPLLVSALHDVPLRQVVCGGAFSLCVTMSGSVFAWGRNDLGQLGLGDSTNRSLPYRCTGLKSQAVVFVSCGEGHSVFLTKDGGVFSCGTGGCGQLGHNSRSNTLAPTKVFELMGRDIAQVACGRRHTMALMTSTGALMSFGLGASGQLGVGHCGDLMSPTVMKGPWVKVPTVTLDSPPPLDRRLSVPDLDEPMVILRVFAGLGDFCFLLAEEPCKGLTPEDFRQPSPPKICHLSRVALESLRTQDGPLSDVARAGLASISGLATTFSTETHFVANSANPGVDMTAFCRLLDALSSRSANDTLRKAVQDAFLSVVKGARKNYPAPECLRPFLLLSQAIDLFQEPSAYLFPLCEALHGLDKVPQEYLERWLRLLPIRCSSKLLYAAKDSLLELLKVRQKDAKTSVACAIPEPTHIDDRPSIALLHTLRLLHRSNGGREETVLRSDSFYMNDLPKMFDIAAEYYHWLMARPTSSNTVSLCDFPFIFNGVAKSSMLHMDARIQMARAMEKVHAVNFVALYNRAMCFDLPELLFRIRRDHIIEDTVNSLQRYDVSDYKKPLRVVFEGEEAQDEGGVRKEYLMLFFRALLDPNFAMFRFYEDTRMLWFHEATFEEPEKFGLIGTMCGLSVYNNSLVDLNFPLALYKKILSHKPVLDDMKELDPSVGRSLQSILDYEEDDFEEVFCLTFSLNMESFGAVTTVDLKKGGRDIPVTQENKAEYVDLYTDYIFNRSCENMYSHFHTAFHQVFVGKTGTLLQFFEPEELQTLLVGNQEYDWEVLKSSCTYKDEYWHGHPVITWFWEVLLDFPEEKKKKFLLFLTGSDRVPIQGMGAIKVYIQPNAAGDNFLPVAHTCFNLLDLPKYSSKEILQAKLECAIEQSEGFGLI